MCLQVDVFSFGVFLWEIMTGSEPHHDLAYDEIVGELLCAHVFLRRVVDGASQMVGHNQRCATAH